jgi:hypothetical protein
MSRLREKSGPLRSYGGECPKSSCRAGASSIGCVIVQYPRDGTTATNFEVMHADFEVWCMQMGSAPVSADAFTDEFDNVREIPELAGNIRKQGNRYHGIIRVDTKVAIGCGTHHGYWKPSRSGGNGWSDKFGGGDQPHQAKGTAVAAGVTACSQSSSRGRRRGRPL